MMGFLRGAQRLYPSRPHLVPVWDLSLVRSALSEPTFEKLHTAELRVLSFKMMLLLALACGKWVSDCLLTLLVWSSVRMTVWSDCSLDEDMCLKCSLLLLECKRLLLRIPSQCRIHYAKSMVCELIWIKPVISDWQNQFKGLPVSKQWLSHRIVEAIALAYTSKNKSCPRGVHTHSMRKVVSLWAWAKAMSIQDI